MYYVVTRTYRVVETVLTKADSVFEAFENAGNDMHCSVQSESTGDYEPDYQSVSEVAYVSEATKKEIEGN